MKKILFLILLMMITFMPAFSEEKPDFGPYMETLQRRIKQNWTAPLSNESQQVIVEFRLSKEGRILSSKIYKSSGKKYVDNAAMKAIDLAAPFGPLPKEFTGKSVDIRFTFDYNVFHYTEPVKSITNYEEFKNQREEFTKSGQITNKRMRFSAGENGEVKIQELD